MSTHASSLKQRLSFFDAAVKEVLSKTKNYQGKFLIEFVQDDTNFNYNLYSLIRKHLNLYTSDEDIYDIVVTAFAKLFLDNINKAFYEFDGEYETGGKVVDIQIERYLHKLLFRAIVTESKKFSEHYKRHQDITPFEDESDEDALDREFHKRVKQFDASDERLLEELMTALAKKYSKERNFERIEKILQMLILGHSKTEIAKEIEISNSRVGDFVWVLKDSVKELSKDLANEGDSDLVDLLSRQAKK